MENNRNNTREYRIGRVSDEPYIFPDGETLEIKMDRYLKNYEVAGANTGSNAESNEGTNSEAITGANARATAGTIAGANRAGNSGAYPAGNSGANAEAIVGTNAGTSVGGNSGESVVTKPPIKARAIVEGNVRRNPGTIAGPYVRPFLVENARPVLGEYTRPVLGGNARPVFGGNATPVLRGNARPFLGGNARPVFGGNARQVLGGNGRPILGGNSGTVTVGKSQRKMSEAERQLIYNITNKINLRRAQAENFYQCDSLDRENPSNDGEEAAALIPSTSKSAENFNTAAAVEKPEEPPHSLPEIVNESKEGFKNIFKKMINSVGRTMPGAENWDLSQISTEETENLLSDLSESFRQESVKYTGLADFPVLICEEEEDLDKKLDPIKPEEEEKNKEKKEDKSKEEDKGKEDDKGNKEDKKKPFSLKEEEQVDPSQFLFRTSCFNQYHENYLSLLENMQVKNIRHQPSINKGILSSLKNQKNILKNMMVHRQKYLQNKIYLQSEKPPVKYATEEQLAKYRRCVMETMINHHVKKRVPQNCTTSFENLERFKSNKKSEDQGPTPNQENLAEDGLVERFQHLFY